MSRSVIRYLLAVVAIIIVAVGAYGLWIVTTPGAMTFAGEKTVPLAEYIANHHTADPTGVPAELAQASVIKRGEYLTRAADCTACHTAKGGVPFAGGLAFTLPFGTIYSPDVTAD